MHYGIEVVPFGDYANPRRVMELAQAAEAAGWEAIALWDHLLFPYGTGDPWVRLAAVAAVTKKIKLCTGVAPLPRYKPQLLARTLVGLDLLSDGRVVFGAGAGVDFDFTPFGEATGAKTRAAMLDEGLVFLTGLLSGQPLTHHGRYYQADGAHLVPSPVQQPRIPVWIGGDSKAAYRRAAQWDGWIIGAVDEMQNITLPPNSLLHAYRPFLTSARSTPPLTWQWMAARSPMAARSLPSMPRPGPPGGLKPSLARAVRMKNYCSGFRQGHPHKPLTFPGPSERQPCGR